MVKAFNMTFGHDEHDVEAWGRMCVLVDMENIPEGLEARRQVKTTDSLSSLAGIILSSILKSLHVLQSRVKLLPTHASISLWRIKADQR